jgi:hypothetical protein
MSTRYHYNNPTKHVGLVQSEFHHHFIETYSRYDRAEKLLTWCKTTIIHSLTHVAGLWFLCVLQFPPSMKLIGLM